MLEKYLPHRTYFASLLSALLIAHCGWAAGIGTPQRQYSTYFGGSGRESPAGDSVVDKDGNYILVGNTDSPDFETKNAMYSTLVETTGWYDSFVSKFDSSGNLLWSTYIGTSSRDDYVGVRVDDSGYIYVCGAMGPGAPTTSGVIQEHSSETAPMTRAFEWDAYLCKIKPDGSGFVWATYLGMPGVSESFRSLDIDASGNVYVTDGYNGDPSSPTGHHTTPWPSSWFRNAYQSNPQGMDDTIVIKIRNDGKAVLGATYIGGSGNESSSPNLEVGPNGDVYVLTWTDSTDIPTTSGAWGQNHLGGRDIYVAIFDENLSQLKMATRFGGNAQDGAAGKRSIAVDANGDFVFGGFSRSTNLPITASAAHSTPLPSSNGVSNLTVKMSPAGVLLGATYIGTTEGYSLDAAGNVYFTATAESSSFPTTPDAFQSTLNGSSDAAVVIFSSDLTSFLYSSYIGGSNDESGRMSIMDPASRTFYTTGWTYSSDFPTLNAHQNSFGGTFDIHITKWNIVPVVDFDRSGRVDFHDFAALSQFWLQAEPAYDIVPSPHGDGIVDFKDLEVLVECWLTFPGLIAYWKLDEAEGGVAYDDAGDKDGALHGDPNWQDTGGWVAGALEFDGVDDYVSTDFILDPADGPFSVFAWIKGGAPGQVVISQTNGAGNGWSWLCVDSLGNLMTDLRAPGPRGFGPPLVSDFVITDGSWHCIGLVWDTSYRYLYADGAEVKKDSAPQPILSSATGGLYFGGANTLTATAHWFGLIDEIRIYNRAVSP